MTIRYPMHVGICVRDLELIPLGAEMRRTAREETHGQA